MTLQGATMIKAIIAALFLSLAMMTFAQAASPEQITQYRAAAEEGEAWGQYNLGVMYAKGEGVPEDNVMAYMWWNLAAAQANEVAKTNKGVIQERKTKVTVKYEFDIVID